MNFGIVLASDQTLEWALPWWLSCYQKYNSFPVAFIDLGLSYEGKTWCQKHGIWIPLRVAGFAEDPSPGLEKKWTEESGKQFLEARDAWFKKPLACLKSPFKRAVYLDVDCEVKGSLSPLFEFEKGMAMALDFAAKTPYPTYNSGVIAFKKEDPLLLTWAKWCREKNHLFRGDQEVFSYMLFDTEKTIQTLPQRYNYSRLAEERDDTIVQHWHGNHGKFVIRTQIQKQGWEEAAAFEGRVLTF